MTEIEKTDAQEIKEYLEEFQSLLNQVLGDEPKGIYLHGSLAMGGFNPKKSDIDLIIVMDGQLTEQKQKELAQFFLAHSNHPYPLEVSMLTAEQVKPWRFPTPYEFHYSEYWRERYEIELMEGTSFFLNRAEKTDSDLAAHFTILLHRGICVAGEPIPQIFPVIPKEDYISSILGDYEDCLNSILQKPVYCVLNLIRIYWHMKEGKISSKQEAASWGAASLPKAYQKIVAEAAHTYEQERLSGDFAEKDLLEFRNYLKRKIEELLESV